MRRRHHWPSLRRRQAGYRAGTGTGRWHRKKRGMHFDIAPGERPSGRFNMANKLMNRLILGLATLKRRKRRAPNAFVAGPCQLRPKTR